MIHALENHQRQELTTVLIKSVIRGGLTLSINCQHHRRTIKIKSHYGSSDLYKRIGNKKRFGKLLPKNHTLEQTKTIGCGNLL